METITYTKLDYHEVDEACKQYFGIDDYEFVAEEECHNDSMKEYYVTQRDIDDFHQPWQQEDWKEFLNGKRMYRGYLLMTALVDAGYLPLGNILVDVSW